MKNQLMYIVFFPVFLLLGCTSPPAQPEPIALTPVKVQLSWVHEYSIAPFHAAVREGYFTSQGLDATLIEGGFGENGYIDPHQEVLNGVVDFGMSSSASLVDSVDDGLPLIAVANLLQRNPLALMTVNAEINSIKDLPGHSILVADGGAREALEALLVAQDIALDSVEIIPRMTFGVEPILNGEVDVLVAWRINEGVALEEAGLEPTFFLFSDYGIENYSFVLFTRRELVENQPELVQRFVNALHFGNDFVLANPAKAIDHTLSYNPELNKAEQLRRLEATIPLMDVNGIDHLTMGQDIWEFSYQLMLANNFVGGGLDVTTAYTNQFAEAADDLELK